MKRLFLALSGISLMVAVTGCCCGASQCCGYGNPCGGGCPNGACGVGGGPGYPGAALPGATISAAVPVKSSTVVQAPTTYGAHYPATAMLDPMPTY